MEKKKIYYIVSWYRHEIEGQIHCNNEKEPILFDNREEAFAYLDELITKNPDYEFSLRSTRPGRGDI